MKKLGEYFQDFSTSPTKLIQFVWFGLCYHFGRRGREGWREMTKNTFVIKLDEENHEYLCENTTMSSKNHQRGPRVDENDYSDPRVYDKNLLSGYKLYTQKQNENCTAFFQAPRTDWNKTDNCWFKNAPLGRNTIFGIMARISKSATSLCGSFND